MEKMNNTLFKNDNTQIFHEDPCDFNFNAPHTFTITNANDIESVLATIHFQEGPIKEVGINGIAIEDLIAIAIERLSYFQKSNFGCKENDCALLKLEEAALWLNKRTEDRKARAVEGVYKV